VDPNREEVSGGWRKLCNEELHDLYSLPDSIRMNRHCSPSNTTAVFVVFVTLSATTNTTVGL
jgi:hypothetical protein